MRLGIGPQGLGGDGSPFAVHVELAAIHITINPVAVNMQYHSARRAYATIFHPTGTCQMGSDNNPLAVLDSSLLVLRVKGLRIVDYSAMPTLLSGNTSGPAVILAERASNLILGQIQS